MDWLLPVHFTVILSMKTREWYEDSIQSILCECLPQIPKSNIRPAYSKSKLTNPFAKNYVDAEDEMKDGLKNIKNTDNYVYFWLHFDSIDMLSTEVSNGNISSILPFRLTVSVYGRDSLPIAIRIRAFMRTEGILYRMLGMQATLNSDPSITTLTEDVQGEWWERNDLEIIMNVLIDDFVGANKAAQFSFGEGDGYSTATGGQISVEEVG